MNDPIIEKLHAIREKMAAEYNFDVAALGQAYIARQQTKNLPVVSRQPKRVENNYHRETTDASLLDQAA